MSDALVAEALATDARIADAKQAIAEAARAHRKRLDRIRPPQSARVERYAEALERFSKDRGGNLFYPYLGSGAGAGAFVELADGSVKLDMISGIGVHYFGHGTPELTARLIDAALADTVMQGNLQQNADSATLVSDLLALANARGGELAHCFLTTSGAMANENALKLAFSARQPADRLLAFERCFAGRTLAMSQVTDNPAYRAGLPAALAVDYVPFFDPDAPDESTARAVSVLRAHLARYPGRHAAMILELVQGEGGYHPGDGAYFRSLCEVLREHEVAIWFDEIQTFGRTEAPFAFQAFGLDAWADLVTVGKTSQVCATLFAARYRPPPGLVSQTFTGASASIAAARYVIERFAEGYLFGPNGRVAAISDRFTKGFEAIRARHPEWLSGPYGMGSMLACTPFAGEREITRRLLDDLFASGVIAFSTGGAVARLRFLPPVGVIRDAEIDTVLEVLEASLARVAASRGGASE